MRFGVLTIVLAACLWAGAAAQAQPKLAYDSQSKRYDAAPGEEYARYSFIITNVFTNDIVIDAISNSCGCTTVSLPRLPWRLAPNESGEIKAQIHLIGKTGLITKTMTNFYHTMPDKEKFVSVASLVVYVPPPPAARGKLSDEDRAAAMLKAKNDAQAIFSGDCAKCHADRGAEKYGQDLYAVDCGICHESSRRASSVPDLHALKQPTDFDYWKTVITLGKPHTMMPAFAESQGGPLTDAQILSLATYLDHTISHHLTEAKR